MWVNVSSMEKKNSERPSWNQNPRIDHSALFGLLHKTKAYDCPCGYYTTAYNSEIYRLSSLPCSTLHGANPKRYPVIPRFSNQPLLKCYKNHIDSWKAEALSWKRQFPPLPEWCLKKWVASWKSTYTTPWKPISFISGEGGGGVSRY